jgi:hypothetical protein
MSRAFARLKYFLSFTEMEKRDEMIHTPTVIQPCLFHCLANCQSPLYCMIRKNLLGSGECRHYHAYPPNAVRKRFNVEDHFEILLVLGTATAPHQALQPGIENLLGGRLK